MVEKILLLSYLVAIILFIWYNNDYFGYIDRYDFRKESHDYFKYEHFQNISTIDKSGLTSYAINKIDYDFYDYLEFLLTERLFQEERSPNRVIGSVRLFQARVTLDWNDNFGSTWGEECYKELHSESCSLLYDQAESAVTFTKPTTCALSDCSEYELSIKHNLPQFVGKYGTYTDKKGYLVDFYYGLDNIGILRQLKANGWIDRNTRAVLLRFTVYNYWVKRYLYVEASIEIPTWENLFSTFYINSVSLIDSENGVLIFCIIVLSLNWCVYFGKIVFEMSIGLSIVTNLLETLNCILQITMVITKIYEFSIESTFDVNEIDKNEFVNFAPLESTTAVNNSLAILATLFIPFRFFTLCSHFKFFNHFATMIKVYYRMFGQIIMFIVLAIVILISWTAGLYFFFNPYCYKFRNFPISLVSVLLFNFWEDDDYQYMIRSSPHEFIFVGAVIFVLLSRYIAFILIATMGVFLYKRAAAQEKLALQTPLQKMYMETMEDIQETVNKLYAYKKEELKAKEKKYGSHQNKKIVAWMLNRKKHLNEKERQAFFKKLNPHRKGNPAYDFESKKNIPEEQKLISPGRKNHNFLYAEKESNKTEYLGSHYEVPENEDQHIQPILFEFPFQLKSFLRSLFQLKPILISSYSVDKFRIVIENYVNESNFTSKQNDI